MQIASDAAKSRGSLPRRQRRRQSQQHDGGLDKGMRVNAMDNQEHREPSGPLMDSSGGTLGGTSPAGSANLQEVASQVQQTVGQTIEQARQQGMGHLDAQKDKAAETVGGVAQALRQTGSHLREGNQD